MTKHEELRVWLENEALGTWDTTRSQQIAALARVALAALEHRSPEGYFCDGDDNLEQAIDALADAINPEGTP